MLDEQQPNEWCLSLRKLSLLCYHKLENKNYKPKLYKGSCKTDFKKHYSNHKKSFHIPLYKHRTKLSTEHWKLKKEATKPTDIL